MSERGTGTLSDAAEERYHGHLGAASAVPHALWMGLIGLFTIPAGIKEGVPPWSWIVAGSGGLLIACAFGIFRASEWARLTSGVLILTMASAFFWYFFLVPMRYGTGCSPGFPLWFSVSGLCGLVGTGLWMLSPMAAKRFRRAREFRLAPHGKWS